MMGGRVSELRDVSNYYPSPTFQGDKNVDPALHPQPSSNGSVCADNVLHNELPKICEMTCSSLSNKMKRKRKRVGVSEFEGPDSGFQGKGSHISVERNRRKQMNDNLATLRSLMPSFYIKRGDQASIVGGVVDYIVELQQILQLLEAKERRKLLLCELVPSFVHTMPFKTVTSQSQKPDVSLKSSLDQVVINSTSSTTFVKNELLAQAKSRIATVEVKFSGVHLVLKTVSRNIPGQAAKIIWTLEDLKLKVLHVRINRVDETTMCKYFTIKIRFDCQHSAEDVAQQVLQTFDQ